MDKKLWDIGQKWIEKWEKSKDEAAQQEFEAFWQYHVSKVNQEKSNATKLVEKLQTRLDIVEGMPSTRKSATVDWRSATSDKATGGGDTAFDKITKKFKDDDDWSLGPNWDVWEGVKTTSNTADIGHLIAQPRPEKQEQKENEPINWGKTLSSMGFHGLERWKNIGKNLGLIGGDEGPDFVGDDAEGIVDEVIAKMGDEDMMEMDVLKGPGKGKGGRGGGGNGELVQAIRDLIGEIKELKDAIKSDHGPAGIQKDGSFKPLGNPFAAAKTAPTQVPVKAGQTAQFPTMPAILRVLMNG